MDIEILDFSNNLERAEVIKLIDVEFRVERHRNIHICSRFSWVFAGSDDIVIIVARDSGMIIGCAVVRLFKGRLGSVTTTGAMIGFVCVRKEWRGHGVGSRLISFVDEIAGSKNLDFGVLWAANHSLYADAGWSSGDTGILVELGVVEEGSIDREVIISSPREFDDKGLYEGCRMVLPRTAEQYSIVPMAAETCVCATVSGLSAQVLLGIGDKGAYVYDYNGHVNDVCTVLHACQRCYYPINVNVDKRSQLYAGIIRTMKVNCRDVNLTMWKAYSALGLQVATSMPYVTMFDRI